MNRDRSVLAIDPTSRGIAFVFIEAGRLLDWGERSCRRELASGLATIERLLDEYPVDALVIENPNAKGCERRARIRVLLRAIVTLTDNKRSRLIAVPRAAVRSRWKAGAIANKESAAAVIAGRFPELSAIVPPPRRPGWNEDSRVNVFDAASLALYVLELDSVGL